MTLKQETIELIEKKARKLYNEQYAAPCVYFTTMCLTDPEILASVKGEEWVRVEDVINYIDKDAEILMPIDEFFKEDGSHITQKEYGLILIKYLVSELRKKFLHIDSKKHNTQDKCEECGYVDQPEFRKCYNCNHPKQSRP